MPEEIIQKRQWNSRTVRREQGKADVEFRVGWLHYLSEDGLWKPINTDLTETPSGFEVTEAPFKFRAPLYADEEASFESNVRFDIFEKKEIQDLPFSYSIRAASASHSVGEIFDFSGLGRRDAVLYRNAFPDQGADLIYYVRHGRAPRLEKLIRFNAEPPKKADLDFPFILSFQEDPIIAADTKDQSDGILEDLFTEEEKGGILKKINEDRDKIANGKDVRVATRELISLTNRKWRRAKLRKWKKNGELFVSDSMSFIRGNKDSLRGVGMKEFKIWDSNSPDRKEGKVSVSLSSRGEGVYVFTKHIKRSFFADGVVYPCFSDSTSTFYPDPNAETTSVDGRVSGDDATWNTIHDATSGDLGADDSTTLLQAECVTGYRIRRGFILFDTSSIPDDNTVTAATVQLYITQKGDDNTARSYITVIGNTSPASNTALAAGDFDQCGAIDNPTKMTNDVDITGISASAYNTWTCNATGIAAISKTGITKWGIRIGSDIEDIAPTGGNDDVRAASADTAGTAQDPRLVVTLVDVPADPTGLTVSENDASTTLDLSWTDNADNELGFSIEASTTGTGAWAEIGTSGSNETTFSHDVAAYDTGRYYRVRAYIQDSGTYYSGYTSAASGTTAPAAPTDLASSIVSGTYNIYLSWVDNSSTETHFSVERSTSGTGSWAQVGTDAGTAYTDSVGSGDATRYYRVRGVRTSGTVYSAYSGTTSKTTPPSTPSSLAVTQATSTSATVTWTDNSSTDSYTIIERKEGERSFETVGTSSGTSLTDSSIQAEYTYTYRARAFRSSDSMYSPYTASVSFASAPSSPSGVRALPVNDVDGDVSIQVVWENSSSIVDLFTVQRSTNGTTFVTIGTVGEGNSLYEDTGTLSSGSTYYYRVIASNSSGSSDASVAASCYPLTNTAAGLEYAFLKRSGHFPRQ